MRGSPMPYRPPTSSSSYSSPSALRAPSAAPPAYTTPAGRRPPAPQYSQPSMWSDNGPSRPSKRPLSSSAPAARPPPGPAGSFFVRITDAGHAHNQKKGIQLSPSEVVALPWSVPPAGPYDTYVMLDSLDVVVVPSHAVHPVQSIRDEHAAAPVEFGSATGLVNGGRADRSYTLRHGGGLTVGTTGSEHLSHAMQGARALSGMKFVPNALRRGGPGGDSTRSGSSQRSSVSYRSQGYGS